MSYANKVPLSAASAECRYDGKWRRTSCINGLRQSCYLLTCSCIFCGKGLQCVLSTVGIPASVLLQAVRTVSETAQKQSKYIMYRDNLPSVYCILFVSYILVPALPISQIFRYNCRSWLVLCTPFCQVPSEWSRGCPTGGIQFSTCTNPIIHLFYPPKILHNHCFQFLLGHKDVLREI